MAAAVVELDPLADPIGPAPQNEDFGTAGRCGFAFAFVAAVQIGGVGSKLGGASIDLVIGWGQPGCVAQLAHLQGGQLQVRLLGVDNASQLAVAEPHPLGPAQCGRVQRPQRPLEGGDFGDLGHKPGVVAGDLGHCRLAVSGQQRLIDRKKAVPVGDPQQIVQRSGAVVAFVAAVGVSLQETESVAADLQTAHSFLQRLLEGAPDRHGLAHRFHLRAQLAVDARELFKGPARHLDHDIVDRRLEGGHGLARDVVFEFVQRVADRHLGSQLGYRKAGRLGRQG